MMTAIIGLIVFCSILNGIHSVVTDMPDIDWSKVKVPDTLPEGQNSTISTDENVGLQTRIVGGKIAIPHQFPYIVGMLMTLPQGMSLCGGSLISKDWILTAAHCLKSASDGYLYFGTHYMDRYEKDAMYMAVRPQNYIIHENYSERRFSNDIALIRLPRSVPLNANVQTIKLPKSNTMTDGRYGIVSGWGKTGYRESSSNVLRYIERKMLPYLQCQTAYSLGSSTTQICLDSSDNKAACQGDSGGPLVIRENGQNILVGLTSFGDKNCEKGLPTVFTRVSYYLDWIAKYTGIRS